MIIARNSLVDEGDHKGRIDSVYMETVDNYFDQGRCEVITFKVQVMTELGAVPMYFRCKFTWSAKGNFVKTLEKLQSLPELGESLNTDMLIGMPVTVTIRHNVKDGMTYSNIAGLARQEEMARMPRERPVLDQVQAL